MIHWKLCKRLSFGYSNKHYWHKSEFLQENEMHRIPWKFLKIKRNPLTKRNNYSALSNLVKLGEFGNESPEWWEEIESELFNLLIGLPLISLFLHKFLFSFISLFNLVEYFIT